MLRSVGMHLMEHTYPPWLITTHTPYTYPHTYTRTMIGQNIKLVSKADDGPHNNHKGQFVKTFIFLPVQFKRTTISLTVYMNSELHINPSKTPSEIPKMAQLLAKQCHSPWISISLKYLIPGHVCSNHVKLNVKLLQIHVHTS